MHSTPANTSKEHTKKPDDIQPDTILDTHQKKTDPDEIGGPKGPEPTRYGDWERRGRCIDFQA